MGKLIYNSSSREIEIDDRTLAHLRVAILKALREAGIEPHVAIPLSRSEEVKGRLRAEIEYAKSIGIFGAPFFVAGDGELFWGDDRLEEALEWARDGR